MSCSLISTLSMFCSLISLLSKHLLLLNFSVSPKCYLFFFNVSVSTSCSAVSYLYQDWSYTDLKGGHYEPLSSSSALKMPMHYGISILLLPCLYTANRDTNNSISCRVKSCLAKHVCQLFESLCMKTIHIHVSCYTATGNATLTNTVVKAEYLKIHKT